MRAQVAQFVIACLWCGVACGQGVLVGTDGTLMGSFLPAFNKLSLCFGLPQTAPEQRLQENGILRTVWVTNGIRYTQTVLLSSVSAEQKSGAAKPVLLVNVAGENTNSTYAEAAAELSLHDGEGAQRLEFAEGFVWRISGQQRCLLGALDVPQPGVRRSSGESLLFSGNMPPSEKGSLTLKLPLESIETQSERDALSDLDFAEELRRISKSRPDAHSAPVGHRGARLLFAPERAGPTKATDG